MFRTSSSFALVLMTTVLFAEPPAEAVKKDAGWRPLFDGKSLAGWESTKFGGEGEVTVEKGELLLNFGEPLTGVTFQDPKKLLKKDYELSLEAMRVDGTDFFCGLTFPVRDEHCSFIVGGWGGGLCGISCIDGHDASENETTEYREFKDKKWYKIRVKVTEEKLQAWIDDDKLVDVDIKGRKLRTRNEVDLSQPLGLSAFRTKAAIRNIQIRPLDPPAKAPAQDK